MRQRKKKKNVGGSKITKTKLRAQNFSRKRALNLSVAVVPQFERCRYKMLLLHRALSQEKKKEKKKRKGEKIKRKGEEGKKEKENKDKSTSTDFQP